MKYPRILFVATTDSYLKWANSLRLALPSSWFSELVIAKSLQNPSERQIALAMGQSSSSDLQFKHILSLVSRIKKTKLDAVFVGATGPFLAILRWLLDLSKAGRQVRLISGSPGIAFHLDGDPLKVRSNADLILVASQRERMKLGDALEAISPEAKIALCSLSFLKDLSQTPKNEGPETLVFAPQPDMPKTRVERERILTELASLKARRSNLQIVIKLRAISDEPQTHFEAFSYQDLYRHLTESKIVSGGEFLFETGSIEEQMANKNATLLTVSSTAALESLAMNSPTQIIGDFELSHEIANEVFRDSNLVAKIRDYKPSVSLSTVPSEWMNMNYFHDPKQDDWLPAIETLCGAQRKGHFALTPKNLSKPMFIGELLRVLFPNRIGALVIRSLKLLSGRVS